MVRQEMTQTIRRHFNKRSLCPVCNKPIEEFDDVQQVKFRNGRCTMYSFFHTQCLVEFEFGVRGSKECQQ